jgi:hypothetical protein
VSSQFAVPTSDDANPGGWTKSTGTAIWSLLDDATRQPATPTTASDFIQRTTDGGVGSTFSINFADPGGHPNGIDAMTLWVFISNTSSGGLDLSLNANVSAASAGTGDGGLLPDQTIYTGTSIGANAGQWVQIGLEAFPLSPADWPVIVQFTAYLEGGNIKMYDTYIEIVPTAAGGGPVPFRKALLPGNTLPFTQPFTK